jgi:quercetin dioxygenase-like cupin family protein
MKSSRSFAFAFIAATSLLGASAFACASDAHHSVVSADAVKWGAGPPSLPPGAKASVLYGNPANEGPFVMRLKFPAGFVIPPHRHSKDELVTVISGHLKLGTGEKIDRAALNPLPPGTFVNLPGNMPHAAFADAEVVVQISGVGPFDVTYLNPKDDPRPKK